MAYIYVNNLEPEPEEGQESTSHHQSEPDWKKVVDAQRITLSEQYARILELEGEILMLKKSISDSKQYPRV